MNHNKHNDHDDISFFCHPERQQRISGYLLSKSLADVQGGRFEERCDRRVRCGSVFLGLSVSDFTKTARRENESKDGVRERREAVYRFMSAMTGDLPGFEEAIRALFSGDQIRFLNQIDSWPYDMQVYTKRIAEDAF